jgi:hypothetical protein
MLDVTSEADCTMHANISVEKLVKFKHVCWGLSSVENSEEQEVYISITFRHLTGVLYFVYTNIVAPFVSFLHVCTACIRYLTCYKAR